MTDWRGIPEEYRNKIVTGDARELAKRIPDESVDLIIADPPYFRVANSQWDKQWDNVQEWADWCYLWAKEVCRILKQNGSAYIFGDEKNIAYLQVLIDGLDWGLLNNITWSKTNYTMLKASPDMVRSYMIQGEERILFYGRDIRTFADVVVPMSAAPMAQYLESERKRAGLTRRQVATYFPSKTGGLTGCVTNWEKGYNFPTAEIYSTLRKALNERGQRNGEYLRQEYEDLRQEYEDLRRPFYGGVYTDVWVGPLINATRKTHICEKPQWINRRMIESSSKPEAIVLDMFTGSGSAASEAMQLGRSYIAFEIDPDTAKIARKRVRETQPPLFVPQPEQLELMET